MPGLFDPPAAPPTGVLAPPVPAAPPEQFDAAGVLLPATPLRRFDDAAATRALIYRKTLDEVRKIPPVANKTHTLSLVSADYEDPDTVSKKKHKQAILEGGTLGRRIRGVFRLTDNATGDTVDERKVTVASVPHMSDIGTFTLNGSDTSLASQMRLRSGAFTRIKESGEAESHINVLPGKGLSHRLLLDPESGALKLGISGGEVPLLPVLKAMGVPEPKIRAAWGDELYAANAGSDDAKAVDKLFAKIAKAPNDDPAARRQTVADFFGAMELDPEVTKRTLGTAYTHLTPEVYLDSVKKLLAVHKGEADADDRDGLAYQHLLGPEDLIAERVKSAASVLRPLLWRASPRKSLEGMPAGFLSKMITGAITNSGLGQSLEEVNLTDALDQMTRISRLGVGGIPSIDSIPDAARSVQPSQLGFIDSLRTPESEKAGVDVRIASAARKGEDGRVYTPFFNTRTGRKEYKSPQDLADSVVAFPGELDKQSNHIIAITNGRIGYVPKAKVDYALPDMEDGFNHLSNLIPGKSASKGQRVMMGSRMMSQSLPLLHREAPLVQSGVPGSDQSYDERYAPSVGAVTARGQGKVMSVDKDSIKVRYEDGTVQDHDLYDNHPLNRKTFAHNEAKVEVGQMVQPGQLLASSNHTDDKGVMAIGTNLRTAYHADRGHNFEDAISITESGAQKLVSEHMYQHPVEWDDKTKRGRNTFLSLFPGKFDRKTLSTLDDDGIVKPGTVVEYGHPLILLARERDRAHNQISRAKGDSHNDSSELWDHTAPGIVTDVSKTKDGASVTVKAYMPIQVGDKLSGKFGDKGIIARIIPDHESPRGEDGRPFDILVNPLGLITRSNASQVVESMLGKAARKTGIPYKVHDFKNIPDLTAYALAELKKHGLSDTETLTDPTTGRKIPGIQTGERFFMKLHHTAEAKAQGRGIGSYSAEGAPTKGATGSSKRVSIMDVNALNSHGATEVVRDGSAIRGQRNPEYWSAFMRGEDPPEPTTPLIFQKYLAQLRAAGTDPVPEGRRTRIMAMTNKAVDKLTGNREIASADTVDWKAGLKPIPGGLFDPALTGGHLGNRWSHIRLHEPMPNPVMEEPIRRMLGLTEKKFESILAGREQLRDKTGPEAIKSALDEIDVKKELEWARTAIQGTRKGARDLAIRKLEHLKTSERTGIHPREWMLDKVPVLPPMFRPVSVMAESGRPLIADANYLYKELIDANNNLKEMKGRVDDIGAERLSVYHAFKGVTGLGDPIQPKNQERRVKGVLKHLFGDSPKHSVLQRKLLGSTVDMVGRATIAPNPDLDMDEAAIPESKAWEMYKPFVVRSLVRSGVEPLRALQLVQDKAPAASKALHDEMGRRPIVATRAPVLHRYGVMALWPKLTKHEVLQISPMIVKGLGADYDGDAMNFHVPVSDGAVRDAIEKMLPSKNLFSVKDFSSHMLPINEYVGGLYAATTAKDERPEQVFHRIQDVIRAYRNNEIDASTKVRVME